MLEIRDLCRYEYSALQQLEQEIPPDVEITKMSARSKRAEHTELFLHRTMEVVRSISPNIIDFHRFSIDRKTSLFESTCIPNLISEFRWAELFAGHLCDEQRVLYDPALLHEYDQAPQPAPF